MTAAKHPAREALLDLLMDLHHDLGKYLRLPLGFLPREAGDAQVREALATALHRTRQGPTGVRGARALWEAFQAEVAALEAPLPMERLEGAVTEALSCERWLEDGSRPVDREAVERALGGVAVAIRELIEEVRGEE